MKKTQPEITEQLNPQQREAVEYTGGAMLVLAGAGSGKTKVLTTRIGWLIQNKAASTEQVLAVTFTNKASKEMMHRVARILDYDTKGMWIGTFHAIALRLLTRHHKEAGLPSYFQIIDSQAQLGVIKRTIRSLNLDENSYIPKDLQKYINQKKEEGLRTKDVKPSGLREEYLLNIYRTYEETCNRDNLVDFTELLLRSYEMLETSKDTLDKYREQFKHILIDEFQDTNQLQYKWLKLLSTPKTQVFAVGDDDQSIYSFRGARVANMKSFLKDFKVKEPIRLEQNYRSSQIILDAANSVISINKNRIGKNLWTDKKHISDKIRLYEGYTEEDEAYFVADEVQSLVDSGYQYSDFVVLYRSNAQSRAFEQLFYSRKIPYRVYGGLRFFDRQEIKNVLAYLRLILNIDDNDAFLRVVNFPARGIGAKSLELLQEKSLEANCSLSQACTLVEEGKAQTNLVKFVNLIKKLQTDTKDKSLAQVVNTIIENSGMLEHYQSDKQNSLERVSNLNEFTAFAATFKPRDNENPLAAIVTHAILESSEAGGEDGKDNAIQLMTVHAAKGLEFRVVFLVGLEDGLFPHENCLASAHEVEEERRLVYVAITRAKEHLYLLRACSRLMWGKRQSAPLSRFVEEIPGTLISNISGISAIGSDSLNDLESEFGVDQTSPTDKKVTDPLATRSKTSRVKLASNDMILKIGDMVSHAKFGKGKIVSLNDETSKITAEIMFVGIGKKTLDLNIAKIEKA